MAKCRDQGLRLRRATGGRHAEEIPNEPGFCIKDGFIADDGKTPQYELAELNCRFKQWPDARVRVYSRTNGEKVGASLLERKKEKPIPEVFAEMAKRNDAIWTLVSYKEEQA